MDSRIEKRFFIFQQRNWGINFGHQLAKFLNDEKSRFACLTMKRPTDKFIREQNEVEYEHIINYEDILEYPYSCKSQYDAKIIEGFCNEFKLDSIWRILLSDRLLSMNYKKKLNYALFEKNVDNEYIKSFFCKLYKEIKNIFENFKPNLVIMPSIAGTSLMVTYYLAKKRNIKVISVNDTKVIPYFSIVHCPYNSDGEFINFLKRINSGYAVTRKKNEANNCLY